MSPLRVFISHSTKTERARAYLNALIAAIEAKQPELELFVDRQLEVSDEWRRAIYTWLDQANAAVILLSDEAQTSPWVEIEASILTFLHFRGQKQGVTSKTFIVLPVNIAERASANTVTAKLLLTEFQYAGGNTPQLVADEVVKRLCRFGSERDAMYPPSEGAESYIAGVLHADPIAIDGLPRERLSAFVRKCAQEYTFIDSMFSQRLLAAQYDESVKIAMCLVRLDFEAICCLIEELNDFLSTMRRGYGGSLLQILEALSPVWVSESDALVVAGGANSKPGNRRLNVCGAANRWTIECLIRRSRGRPLDLNVKVVYLATPKVENWVRSIKQQLYDSFLRSHAPAARRGIAGQRTRPLRPSWKELEEELREMLADWKKPIFVVFPQSMLPDRQLLDELSEELGFPTLLFVADGVDGLGFAPPILKLKDLNADTARQKQRRYDRVWNELVPRTNAVAR